MSLVNVGLYFFVASELMPQTYKEVPMHQIGLDFWNFYGRLIEICLWELVFWEFFKWFVCLWKAEFAVR